MTGALFISYSHVDRRWLNVFRTHLDGALRGSGVKVWTDRNIRPGATWAEVLDDALEGARSALVLVSPEYLVSDWCRRELAELAEKRRQGKVSAVYWVLLRPCAWAWSELNELQAVQEPPSAAIEAVPAGAERDQWVLDLCGKVARDLGDIAKREDPTLTMVRDLLDSAGRQGDYRLTRELGQGRSDFAVVFQAQDANDREVVIKVLTNTPLHSLRDLFEAVAQSRRANLSDASFVKVDDVFVAHADRDARIVIVSELAPNETLGTLIDEKRHLDGESVGRILRQIAVALAKLHALPPLPHGEPYQHLMGPLIPDTIFWDERSRRPLLSLVGVTSFLWHFFDPDTFVRIVRPKAGSYVAPEKQRREAIGPRVDQYFLGLLALELLEGEHVFRGSAPPQPLDVLKHSSKPWTRHRQFAELLAQLLHEQPAQRFASMHEVADRLATLEEPERVLAKYAFREWIEPRGQAFSQSFYKAFFARDAQARRIFENTLPGPQHHQKLVASLIAVLNYRRGNAPTSIVHLMPRHRGLGIGAGQLASFRDAFLATLARWVKAPKADRDAITAAWARLFEPVLDELARELQIEGWPAAAPPKPAPRATMHRTATHRSKPC